MRHPVRRFILTLCLLMFPDVAMAQNMTGTAIPPPRVMADGADYRLAPLVVHIETIQSPRSMMIARLFASPGASATSSHRHMAVFEVGGMEFVAEAIRERMSAAIGAGRSAHALDRLSAVGFRTDLPLGPTDSLSLGMAADINKRAEPAILIGRKHIDGDGVVADCSWVHGTHLQLSLDWRADHSSSSSGLNRAVEIAQGAALREQGFHFSLSYLIAGGEAVRGTTFGIAGRDARIAAADLATIGSANHHDIQTALFLRTSF